LNEPEPLQLAKFMENYDQDKLAELMARYGLSESDVLKDERWQFALKKELDDAEYVSQLKKQIPPAIPEQQQKYFTKQVYEGYAKNFGLTVEDLRDSKFAGLVKAKINSDVFAAQLRADVQRLKKKVNGLLTFALQNGKVLQK
jgi:hypothetical protein